MSWGQISRINSDMQTPLNVTLGSRADAAGTTETSSLFAWVKGIMARLNSIGGSDVLQHGAIRSIQRGTAVGTNITLGPRVINIGAINPLKAMVVLNGSYVIFPGTSVHTAPFLAALTANSLSVSGATFTAAGTALTFSWQVIEFH